MFSDNHKISIRQTFRLFTFDFLGISTLIVPSYLAEQMGIYGAYGILLGGGMGLIYLSYLGWSIKQMKTDLCTYLSSKENFTGRMARLIYGYLSFSCVLTAADAAAVFSDLIRHSLIKEESYVLILVLMLGVAVYAVSGGIESRARIYEILFWVILIPLFLMLALSLKGIDVVYMAPRVDFSVKGLFKCGYLVFLTFGTLFFILLFPRYLPKEIGTKRLVSCVGYALICAVGILLVLYLILVGTFGQASLSAMEFPAVTLMSSISIPGDFVKRLDAIMMGIWFFTLYALLNLNLHYGYQMMQRAVEKQGKKRFMAATVLLVFAVALLIHYVDGMHLLIYKFFWYIGVPVYVLLPGIIVWKGRRREKNERKKTQ